MPFFILVACLIAQLGVAGPVAILSEIPLGSFAGDVAEDTVGQSGELLVERTPSGTVFTFTPLGARGETREEWLLQGDRLVQKYYDEAGQETKVVKSKISTAFPVGSDQATFYRHCPGRQCADGNARTLAVIDGKLHYTVWDAMITKFKPEPVQADGVNAGTPRPRVESAKRMHMVFSD